MGILKKWMVDSKCKLKKIILQVYTVLLHQVKVHSNAFMFQSDTITHSSFKHWDIHKRHFFILPACTNCCL